MTAPNRDGFGRIINYLRLSITDRCNFRCRYCMPEDGVDKQAHAQILRYEDLLRIARSATALGIDKIRVTGGEPLVRRGVVDFLRELGALPGVRDLALTTNGLLLAEMAADLRAAGVGRVNVSLDSLREQTFAEITRGGDLKRVLAGIEAAAAVGMKIKLNMVVMRGVNDDEIVDFARLSVERPFSVRYIEYMPTIREAGWEERLVSGDEVLQRIAAVWPLRALETGLLCGPARPYRIDNAAGTLGIITPMSDHFCSSCNRLRVTSTGLAKSCLLSEAAVDLKPCLEQADDACLQKLLREIIAGKPAQHRMNENPDGSPFTMSSIGG
jgi:cyclic pyranopterin phosphate synthase